MNKFYQLSTLALCLGFAATSNGQVILEDLNGNNVNATIANNGVFFNDPISGSNGQPGYEYPKGDSNHLIFAQAFWFGAIAEGGGLKIAAELYDNDDGHDLYPGALKADGSAEALVPAYADQIYMVSKEEIEYHVLHYPDIAYDMPLGILDWPAHGDVSMGMDYQLAPFADLNGNGIYEPENGEYPEIRGDHAGYLIMNDMAGPHLNSGGDALGIEIHFMFYQYEEVGDINNTTFVNVRVINRSSVNYSDFIVGNFMDFDIGFSEDDHVGCDSTNNVMYGYNGDFYDEGGAGGEPGYGENPPAIGMVSLNNIMHVSGFFHSLSPPFDDPSSAGDYWNYMNGKWKTGEPFKFGGSGYGPFGDATRYMYSSDPSDTTPGNWSEITEGNPSGDRRVFMASESVPFSVGEVLCYDYAVIVENTGTPIENASRLINQAGEVKSFYDDQPNTYCDFTLELSEEIEATKFQVYPNPSNGNFEVRVAGEFDIEFFALDGRLIYQQRNNVDQAEIQTELARGTYLIAVSQKNSEKTSQLIVIN